MKIAIGSDLHLEGRHLDLVHDGADLLLLAGDILSIRGFSQWDAPYYRDFFEGCIARFKRVLMVCGNHEFYKSDITVAVEQLRLYLEQSGLSDKVTVLDDSYVDIEGIRFIGSTLWTNLNNRDIVALDAANQGLNDFRLIQNGTDEHYGYKQFRAFDSTELHTKSLKAIQNHINATELPVVLMTHHSPSFNSVHEKYKFEWPLNYAFSSDLDDFILSNPQIKLSIHGHVHDSFNYKIGETRVICNPRGYKGENPEPYNFVYINIDKDGNIT